ncbi:hypothetical protein BDW75DRAFT_221617 [Aspergillus navahoensis]
MLQNLPHVLITSILSLLKTLDLEAIRLVSKQLEGLSTPLLFSDLTIHVDENDLANYVYVRVAG